MLLKNKLVERKYKPICDKLIDECIFYVMSCHGFRDYNAMFKRDIEQVANSHSINVSVENTMFKNMPIR